MVKILRDLNQDTSIWQKEIKEVKLGIQTVGCWPLTADAGCGQHLVQHQRLTWASVMSTLKPYTKGWWKCFDCYSQTGSWCIICLFWIEDCSDKIMNKNTSKHCTLSPVPTLKIIPYPRTGCRTIGLPIFLITNGSLPFVPLGVQHPKLGPPW